MTIPIFDHVSNRLAALGVSSDIDDDFLYLTYQGVTSRFKKSEDIEAEFKAYKKIQSRCYFDSRDRSYSRESVIDFPLVVLDQVFARDEDIIFQDDGDQVIIGMASLSYCFASFESESYNRLFEDVVAARLLRKTNVSRSLQILWRRPLVATYVPLLAESPISLRQKGLERVNACLFKLAVEKNLCFEIATPVTLFKATITFDKEIVGDDRIPNVSYDSNLVKYYKVGKASPFSSQAFLSFYHVLEYYFLRVAEESLHHRLRALLNAPSFHSTADGLDRAISLVRKNDARDDETEMLRKVLLKFVSEEDFIVFVTRLESSFSDKPYSKKRKVFGEEFEISLRENHALANAAKVLKHIRNAIVHSSDKYSREECHIPLTESEAVIARYVPIVMYFAEQVISGTAEPISII